MRQFLVGAAGRWRARARLILVLLALLILVLVTGGGALALNSVRSVAAEGAVVVRPEAPASVLDGARFDVDVIAEDVTDLAGAIITLSYDPTHLTFVQAVPNPAFTGCQDDQNVPSSGILTLSITCPAGTDGTPLVLWTVTFDNVAVGTTVATPISVTEAELSSAALVLLPSTPLRASVILNPRADLSIAMTAQVEPAGLGGKFEYSITVTNQGPADATNVVITDVLPEDVVLEKNDSNCFHNSGTISCFITNLPNDASVTKVIEVRVSTFAQGLLSNTVTVAADQDDPNPTNSSATVDTTLHSPVTVKVIAPGTVAPGDLVEVQVQAASAQNLGGAQFDFHFDAARFSFTGAQPDPAFGGCLASTSDLSGDSVRAAIACASGKTGTPLGLWTFTFDVVVDTPSGDTLFSLTDVVLGDTQEPPQGIPATTVDTTIRVARTTDLSVTKTSARDPVVAGTSFAYTVTATNDGPEDALGVTVTDQLPPEETFDSAAQDCVYDLPAHTVTCTVGALANGASANVTINVTALAGTAGTITNTASVTSFEIDLNTANDTATEDTLVIAPPTLTGTAAISLDEGGDGVSTIVDIGVSLSNSIDMPVDVHFETSDGTATATDSDYTPVVNGLVTIPAGGTECTLQVEIVGDDRWEHDEIFPLVITSAEIQGTSISLDIVDGTTAVTIQNDEVPPTLSIQETSSIAEGGPSETATIDLDATLSGLSGLPITVQYDTADGSATAANGDFIPANGGSLTIPPDTLSGTVQIDVTGDDRYEIDETFSVVLSNPLAQENGSQPTIASDTGVVTILNDDSVPTLSIEEGATVAEGAAGTTTTVDMLVTLSNILDVEVTVDYSTSDGTALVGQDFPVASGTATVPSGQTTTAITVQIDGDDAVEGDETFLLVISDATSTLGAIPIASPTSSTITILDDDSAIVAESGLLPSLDGDGVAVAEVRVERFKYQGGALSFELPGGVQSFDSTLTFDAALVEILDVQAVTEFATTFDSTSTPGQLVITGSTAAPVTTTPLVLANIAVRLIGSNASTTQLTLTGLQLTEGGTGTVYGQEFQPSNTYQRGDVLTDGQVRATDRLFLTQCVLQQRDFGLGDDQCNPINAASILHDGVNGDTIDESDGLYISEFVVELRDALFNLIN